MLILGFSEDLFPDMINGAKPEEAAKELSDKIKKLESENQCQKDLIKDQQKVISDLKARVEELEFDNKELNDELNSLDCGANGNGCSELKALNDQAAKLGIENANLKAENRRLQEELDHIAYSCEECDGCESHDAKILDKLARIEELAQKWSQK